MGTGKVSLKRRLEHYPGVDSSIDPNHAAEGFAIEGAGSVGIRKGYKDAHALDVGGVFAGEVHAVASDVQRGKDLIKIETMGVGWPHANDLRKPKARAFPAFCCRRTSHNFLPTPDYQTGDDYLNSHSGAGVQLTKLAGSSGELGNLQGIAYLTHGRQAVTLSMLLFRREVQRRRRV